MAGYSGTPLTQKLGIKPNANVILIKAPTNYRKLLGQLPTGVQLSDRVRAGCHFVHLFATRRSELEKQLDRLRAKLAETGTLWVSWPKKSAGVQTNITEDIIRAVA